MFKTEQKTSHSAPKFHLIRFNESFTKTTTKYTHKPWNTRTVRHTHLQVMFHIKLLHEKKPLLKVNNFLK